jgi:hypothetical protein
MNWQLDRQSRGVMMCASDPVASPVLPVLSVDDPKDEKPWVCHGSGSYLPGQLPLGDSDRALANHLERLRRLIGVEKQMRQ